MKEKIARRTTGAKDNYFLFLFIFFDTNVYKKSGFYKFRISSYLQMHLAYCKMLFVLIFEVSFFLLLFDIVLSYSTNFNIVPCIILFKFLNLPLLTSNS